MTLIDSIYIHNSGGRVLLEILLKKILHTDLKSFFFLFDSRIDKSLISKVPSENFKVLRAGEYNRTVFYKKNQNVFSHFFCFANVPPPIKINKSVTIYFHNDLILNSKNSGIGLVPRLKFYFKKKYIHLISQNNYNWAVQTSLMMEKVKNEFKISSKRISVLPFFYDLTFSSEKTMIKNTFLYVANYSRHKNHKILIRAFQEAALKTDKKIILKLTLETENFNFLMKETNYSISNFELVNLGVLNKGSLIKSYQEANFFIYPSLKESFGLPLIEASSFSGYILASDLDYVHEVISPSLTFNPRTKSEITALILNVLNLKNLKQSKLKLTNKIDVLIAHISNYV